jgi:hypothetical protein
MQFPSRLFDIEVSSLNLHNLNTAILYKANPMTSVSNLCAIQGHLCELLCFHR